MITIKSHGFKFSRPEANIVFDVSYLVNPWRDDEIRNWKGSKEELRDKIISFMQEQKGAYSIARQISEFARTYWLLFPDENIQIAVCCSAGEYRSPAMVELIGAIMTAMITPPKFIIKHGEQSKI